MRAGTYYFVAVLLVLATVPMYRYIFKRARELDDSSFSVSKAVIRPAVVSGPLPVPARQGISMLPGELCEAGIVVIVRGNSYVNALGRDGRSVHCSGRIAYPSE